jgi:hypothetical protein
MEKRIPTRTIGRGFENASGLGFWTSHPLHHAHMVNRQSHVRPEPEEPERRTARAKREPMRPRPPTWFLWECSRESEPDNCPVVRLAFPAAFVVRWKNAFPQLMRGEKKKKGKG